MVEESINDEQPEKLDDFSEENPCEYEGGIMRSKMTLQKLFKYADKVDMVLMILGTLGALANGMSMATLFISTNGLVNALRNISTTTNP